MNDDAPEARTPNPVGRVDFLTKPIVQLPLVLLVGAIGGALSWLWDTESSSLPIQLAFGSAAAVVFVFITLSIRARGDFARLCAVALASGFAWYAVLGEHRRESSSVSPSEPGQSADEIAKKQVARNDTLDSTRPEAGTIVAARLTAERASLLTPEASHLLIELNRGASFADVSLDSLAADSAAVRLQLLQLANRIEDDLTLTPVGFDVARLIHEPSNRLPSTSLGAIPAVNLAINDTVDGMFVEFADNWYHMTVDSADYYSIVTLPPTSGPEADTEISLLDANLSVEGEDDDGGLGTLSRLTEYLVEGQYYVQVSSYDETAGNYRVAMVSGRAVDDADVSYETRVDFSGAQPIEIDAQGVPGMFDGFEDHSYVFEIPDSNFYEITTTFQNPGDSVDTVIELYEADGRTIVGYDDDGGESRYSLLREYLEAGTYYLVVQSYFGLPGSYRVSVTMIVEAPPT